MLVQRGTDPLGYPALNLTIHNNGIDNRAAVFNHDIAQELDLTGFSIDFNRGYMGRVGVSDIRRLVGHAGVKPRFFVGRQARRLHDNPMRQFGDGNQAYRTGFAPDSALGKFKIVCRHFGQARRNAEQLIPQLLRRRGHGAPARHRTPARPGSPPARGGLCIALDNSDVFERNTKRVRYQLGIDGVVALAVRVRPNEDRHLTRLINAQCRRLITTDLDAKVTKHGRVVSRAFHIRAYPHPKIPAVLTDFLLLGPKIVIAENIKGLL